SFALTIPVSIKAVTTQMVLLPDMGGYSTCSMITKPAWARLSVAGRTRLQFAAGYPRGSRSMRFRSPSMFCSRYCLFSNMVLPGTSSTPLMITRPGSPHACRSTAVMRLVTRIYAYGQQCSYAVEDVLFYLVQDGPYSSWAGSVSFRTHSSQ